MKKVGKFIYIGLIFLFLYLPIFTLVILSFNDSKNPSSMGTADSTVGL